MILIEGPNKPWYAQVAADGLITLNPEVPNARKILKREYPNLVAPLDAQDEADDTLDRVLKLLKKKGALAGEDADVFERVERLIRKRLARKGV